ncbi:MAG: carbohydrate ABC transporter permease [Lachnospiraceae bacterium]|nr:carbohydrate ABC transporter permease [Lachnospiraceae bacterium]
MTAKMKKIRKSREDRIFDGIIYTIAVLLTLIALYPMYFIVIASISDPKAVAAGEVILFPSGLNLKGYENLFQYKQLWTGYLNTIIYAVLGTIICLAVNIPAAYALSRKELFGRKLFVIFYLIPMFFTGGLIPTYMNIQNFDLYDSIWVMVLPFSVVTYYIIVARTFFSSSIPDELWEAAQIDGAGTMRYFITIVLPLSKAILAVIALWSAVSQWNSYFNAMIYLRDDLLKPLQLVLRGILINNQTASAMLTGTAATEAKEMAELIKYSVIVISSAPIMCMYPFVQKYFNQGVMVGSLKG